VMTEPMADGLDGLVNLRDLGGLPTRNGSTTRPGVLYRSDAPHAGDRAPEGFAQWPPAAVIDLRDTVEYGTEPHPLVDVSVVHRIPVLEGIRHIVNERNGLDALYQSLLDGAAKKLVEIFRIVTQTEGPVLIHCAAGKDRTGVACALLLSAAGVEAGSIVADYVRTDRNMHRVLQRLNVAKTLPPGVEEQPVAELVAAPAPAIEGVLTRLEEHEGAAPGWLQAHGATQAEVSRWQERFLVDGEHAGHDSPDGRRG
jgi:protein-tyrosine phosphatase